MSGVFGLFNLDGKPVEPTELRDMASLLTQRGPDRTGVWRSGPIGLGHTLLGTTPEMLLENLPLEHSQSCCVITGDIRLDNRDELLRRLGLEKRKEATGDAGLALAAYLEWGEACAQHLLGDFAFAIWDTQRRRLFCARDHMGMRQLIYHHSPGRFFALATTPRAILVLSQVPYRINEARIADYLVEELEGVDKTSTFFEEVYRLPPAHTLTVTPEGIRQQRYWMPEPGPELRLASEDEYAEAFLEVFTEAVRCRLRTVGSVGSMLSGGIDSGSVVAVAARLLAACDRGPLLTFSAVSPDGDADRETRSIHAALTMDGLDPAVVSYGELENLLPELEQLSSDVDEPFDAGMTLVRAVYMAARQKGLTMLLDGVSGDTVLSQDRRLARLLRARRWRIAYREAAMQSLYWRGAYRSYRELLRSTRQAFVPDGVLRPLRPWRQGRRIERRLRSSPIDEQFGRRMAIGERLKGLDRHSASGPLPDGHTERARNIDHPFLTVGRERYDRVAGAVGVEPRDPFLDLRVLSFCIGLPDEQVLAGGWPKAILRRAMLGLLPDEVRWRRGREHLGWAFTAALIEQMRGTNHPRAASLRRVSGYVDATAALQARDAWFKIEDAGETTEAYHVAEAYHVVALAEWLERNEGRPAGRKRRT